MATGVCRICGRSFSNWDVNETVCPCCRYEQNWDRLLTVDTPYTSSVTFDNITMAVPTLGSTLNQPTELTINAQKIVLENGGIQLIVDNDTIKSIDSIEINGIKFERVH